MSRHFSTGWILLALATSSAAQTIDESERESINHRTIISTAEPDPALRYQFWPPLQKRQSANAMPLYSRAVLMSTMTHSRGSELRLESDRDHRWLGSPWKDEYADEISEFLQYHENSLAELERATDRMQIDYVITESSLSVAKLYQTMLPEVQESRALARYLRLRAKLEMHSGRWDEFTRTMQTMFRLAEMVGHAGDLLVCRLVGIAIAETAIATIEEASSLDGCPNFYWAFASLPNEMLDIRRAIDQEMLVLLNLVPGLEKCPDTPIGPEASREKLSEIIDTFSQLMKLSGDPVAGKTEEIMPLVGGVAVIALAGSSRDYLRETTCWGEQANSLSDSECVLRAIAIQLHRATSDILKWTWLPDAIRQEASKKSDQELQRLNELAKAERHPALMFMNLVFPATASAYRAEFRVQQSIAFEATIQGIRDFATKNKRLPKSLAEMDLPAWPDPMSQQPFGYESLQPSQATLTRAQRYPGDTATTFQLQLAE